MSSQNHLEENYINVTPQLLAILTIDRIATYLPRLRTEPSNWWFAIQDVDLALTSQMIAFLSGSMKLGALKENHQKLMLKFLNDRSPNKIYPKNKKGDNLECEIAPFAELLERVADPNFILFDNSKSSLELTTVQKNVILKLHELRNNVAHIQPASWYVEVAGLPEMSLTCMSAIDHLFKWSSQRIELTEAQIVKADKSISEIVKHLRSDIRQASSPPH